MEHLKKALHRELVACFNIRVPLDDDTELFSSGLIDSLNVMELVTFVEGEIGRTIPPAEITLENFDTINRIARFLNTTYSSARDGR
jgi:acyl carrier protein